MADTKPELLVPGSLARYVERARGGARCRRRRPSRQIIWAGNQIIGLPYIYGGGHASFISPGYDCSGTVSFALHGAEPARRAGGLLRIHGVGLRTGLDAG